MSLGIRLMALAALAGAGAPAAGGALASQPEPWQIGLQAPASPGMEAIHDFYDLVFVIIVAIAAFVLALLVYVMVRFNARRNPVPSKTSHNTLLEVLWTAIPVMILVVIAVPSFRLLYYQKTVPEAEMTVKTIGHQWFWSYEYPDHGDIVFDSFIVEEEDLEPGQLRLFEVDNRVVVPVDTTIRLLVTADDVLHSWAIPAFGVKVDAVPGRLNETWFKVEREGVYYGQCSELCGVRHAYMPIVVEAVSKDAFAEWVAEAKEEFARTGAPEPAVDLTRATASDTDS